MNSRTDSHKRGLTEHEWKFCEEFRGLTEAFVCNRNFPLFSVGGQVEPPCVQLSSLCGRDQNKDSDCLHS